MKRSEAIARLISLLGGTMRTEDWADQILTAVEEIGMQPPPVETDLWNRQDNCYHYENEWEKEDA